MFVCVFGWLFFFLAKHRKAKVFSSVDYVSSRNTVRLALRQRLRGRFVKFSLKSFAATELHHLYSAYFDCVFGGSWHLSSSPFLLGNKLPNFLHYLRIVLNRLDNSEKNTEQNRILRKQNISSTYLLCVAFV